MTRERPAGRGDLLVALVVTLVEDHLRHRDGREAAHEAQRHLVILRPGEAPIERADGVIAFAADEHRALPDEEVLQELEVESAPIVGRERSSVCIAIWNPSPMGPMRHASGTRISSKRITAVGEPLMPSLCSSFSICTPHSLRAMKQVMPWWRSSDVRANSV